MFEISNVYFEGLRANDGGVDRVLTLQAPCGDRGFGPRAAEEGTAAVRGEVLAVVEAWKMSDAHTRWRQASDDLAACKARLREVEAEARRLAGEWDACLEEGRAPAGVEREQQGNELERRRVSRRLEMLREALPDLHARAKALLQGELSARLAQVRAAQKGEMARAKQGLADAIARLFPAYWHAAVVHDVAGDAATMRDAVEGHAPPPDLAPDQPPAPRTWRHVEDGGPAPQALREVGLEVSV